MEPSQRNVENAELATANDPEKNNRPSDQTKNNTNLKRKSNEEIPHVNENNTDLLKKQTNGNDCSIGDNGEPEQMPDAAGSKSGNTDLNNSTTDKDTADVIKIQDNNPVAELHNTTKANSVTECEKNPQLDQDLNEDLIQADPHREVRERANYLKANSFKIPEGDTDNTTSSKVKENGTNNSESPTIESKDIDTKVEDEEDVISDLNTVQAGKNDMFFFKRKARSYDRQQSEDKGN